MVTMSVKMKVPEGTWHSDIEWGAILDIAEIGVYVARLLISSASLQPDQRIEYMFGSSVRQSARVPGGLMSSERCSHRDVKDQDGTEQKLPPIMALSAHCCASVGFGCAE